MKMKIFIKKLNIYIYCVRYYTFKDIFGLDLRNIPILHNYLIYFIFNNKMD